MARLEALARPMDGIVTIPGTNIRMGLDGFIDLVPVAGDVVSRSDLQLPHLGG